MKKKLKNICKRWHLWYLWYFWYFPVGGRLGRSRARWGTFSLDVFKNSMEMEQPGGVWRFDGGYFRLWYHVWFTGIRGLSTTVHLVKLVPVMEASLWAEL